MDVGTRVELECSYGAGDGQTRSGVASMPKERSGGPRLDQSCDWEKYGYDSCCLHDGARVSSACRDGLLNVSEYTSSDGPAASPSSRSRAHGVPPITTLSPSLLVPQPMDDRMVVDWRTPSKVEVLRQSVTREVCLRLMGGQNDY